MCGKMFDGLYFRQISSSFTVACFGLKMLRSVIFCHIWFLLTDLICCIENSTDLQAWSFRYVDSSSPPAVIRFSVPEDHHVCLPCVGSVGSDVVWTLRDSRVLVTRQGGYQTNLDRQHYFLLTDGGLCLHELDSSESGEYQCNQQLVAELQVLTGQYYTVSAGRTLLLPCRGSFKPKQRWYLQRVGERREAIFTRFRNGTEKPEKDESRLGYTNDALQIQNLQPEDAGEYLCNGVLQARVTVLSADHPETTRILSSTSTTPASAETKTDVVEKKNKTKKRTENALLLVAVVGMGLLIILMAAVCVLLTCMKCKSKRKNYGYAAAQRQDDTELQLWRTSSTQLTLTEYSNIESSSLPEETIHYASLGRQNWRKRPSWSPPPKDHHSVIYSSVIPRPAAGNTVY